MHAFLCNLYICQINSNTDATCDYHERFILAEMIHNFLRTMNNFLISN